MIQEPVPEGVRLRGFLTHTFIIHRWTNPLDFQGRKSVNVTTAKKEAFKMRFSKHTEAETFNRKELVKALAAHLGVRPAYNGMPTRSYTVGPYTIDWDGSIVGEDIAPLRDFLIENDYAKAEDFEAQSEPIEADAAAVAAAIINIH